MAVADVRNDISEIAKRFKQEEKLLEEGRTISDYAVKLPTLNGAEDKDRVHSYIAYEKLLSKLRAVYRQQVALQQIEDGNRDRYEAKFRQARKFG